MAEPPPPVEAYTAIEVPLRLLVRDLAAEAPRPAPIVLGLHGYALDAPSLYPVLCRMVPDSFLLVAVEGPHSTMVPGKELGADTPRGFHWGVSPRPWENRTAHRNAVEAAIRAAVERGGDAGRVGLVGFSQPCSFNYRLALDPPRGVPFRAIAGLCGGLPGEWTEAEPKATPASRATAVLHVSTKADPFFPVERVAGFAALLEARFAHVDFRLHDGAHRIPGKAIPEVRAFLARHG